MNGRAKFIMQTCACFVVYMALVAALIEAMKSQPKITYEEAEGEKKTPNHGVEENRKEAERSENETAEGSFTVLSRKVELIEWNLREKIQKYLEDLSALYEKNQEKTVDGKVINLKITRESEEEKKNTIHPYTYIFNFLVGSEEELDFIEIYAVYNVKAK